MPGCLSIFLYKKTCVVVAYVLFQIKNICSLLREGVDKNRYTDYNVEEWKYMSEMEDKKAKRHQEDLERLRGFRPIDDTFMRGLFKENIPLAELVLQIITGKSDLKLLK